MRLRALVAALLACTAAVMPVSAAQLTDQPLLLPGRPSRPAQAQGAAVAGTAAAARQPVERYGYFSPGGSPQRRLFYWFYQARNVATGAAINATTTPLIAWFNGGPGCSSLWGMFFENGPYTLTSSLQLAPNNWTWAGAGHMLYIDQPIGTGLSYSTRPGDQTTSQLDVARTVAAFLQAFLKAPAYTYLARNPLYLTGESFAGHYIPAIAAFMRLNTPEIQLAGVAMGNPCTSAPAMYQSYPDYALANGLISSSLHASVVANLASCKLQAAVCGVLDAASCAQATYFCESRIWADLLTAPSSRLARLNPYNIKDTAATCGTAQLYNCYARLDSRLEEFIDANRARLGVPPGIQYRACADAPYFALQPDIAASYDDLVAALVDGGLPVMVYSGINDFVCSWMSSRQWLDSLSWSKQLAWISAPRKTWAGGSFRRLGPLSFVRVARAGHMVPLDQPSLSLGMLRDWIARGEPAPPTARRGAGQ